MSWNIICLSQTFTIFLLFWFNCHLFWYNFTTIQCFLCLQIFAETSAQSSSNDNTTNHLVSFISPYSFLLYLYQQQKWITIILQWIITANKTKLFQETQAIEISVLNAASIVCTTLSSRWELWKKNKTKHSSETTELFVLSFICHYLLKRLFEF